MDCDFCIRGRQLLSHLALPTDLCEWGHASTVEDIWNELRFWLTTKAVDEAIRAGHMLGLSDPQVQAILDALDTAAAKMQIMWVVRIKHALRYHLLAGASHGLVGLSMGTEILAQL